MTLLALVSCGSDPVHDVGDSRAEILRGMRKTFAWNLATLLSSDEAERREAYGFFSAHWTEMRDDVLKLRSSRQDPERVAAVYLLARLDGGDRGAAAIAPLLEDSNQGVRIEVVRGLRRLRDESTTSALGRILATDAKYDEAVEVFLLLAQQNDPRARELVLEGTRDRRWARRRAAAFAIGDVTDFIGAGGILHGMMGDEVWWLRREAALGLGRHRHREALPELRTGLGDPVLRVREACIEALGRIGDPADVDRLMAFAREDADYHIRRAAVHALGHIDQMRVIDLLSEVVHDVDEKAKVRAAAVSTLLRADNPDARKRARAMVASSMESVSGMTRAGVWLARRDLDALFIGDLLLDDDVELSTLALAIATETARPDLAYFLGEALRRADEGSERQQQLARSLAALGGRAGGVATPVMAADIEAGWLQRQSWFDSRHPHRFSRESATALLRLSQDRGLLNVARSCYRDAGNGVPGGSVSWSENGDQWLAAPPPAGVR